MNKKKFKNNKNINFFVEGGEAATPKMDVLGAATGALGGVTSLVGSAMNNLKVPKIKATTFQASSKDDLLNSWSNYDTIKAQKTNVAGSALSGLATGASAGAGFGPWGALAGGVVGGLSNLFTAKAGNRKRQAAVDKVNAQNLSNLDARANGLEQSAMDAESANYAAFGGQFTNNVTTFNNGGTHEQNPLMGIPQGVGQNGKPNLVEEGEVKYKDYIYSNRLKANTKLLEDVGLHSKYEGQTFGDIAKSIQKESEERPNDPISRNGLNDSMNKLKQAQEIVKLKKQQREQNAMQMEMIKQGVNPNMMQNPMQMAQGGELPQGVEANMQQLIQQVAGWLQQGMSPQQIIRQLVTAGIPAQQAQELILQVQQQAQQPEEGTEQIMALGGNLFANAGDLLLRKNVNSGSSYKAPIQDTMFPMPSAYKSKTADDYLNFVTKGNYIPQSVLQSPRPNPTTPTDSNKSGLGFGAEALRYAPVVGSGIMALTDAFGLTNKPDYSTADAIGNLHVKGERVNNYLAYNPFDRDYYINKLNANAGATRSGLANASGGNRATFMAGLLGADHNYNEGLGNMARQAEEYNTAQRQHVEEFNRGTNQFNAQQSNWEQGINNEIAMKAIAARAETKNASSAARMANLNNLFDNLGSLGREEYAYNMIKGNKALNYEIDHTGNTKYKGNQHKNGDKLKKKGIEYGII